MKKKTLVMILALMCISKLFSFEYKIEDILLSKRQFRRFYLN